TNVPLKSIPFVVVLIFMALGRTLAATSAAISHPTSPMFLYSMLPPSWRNAFAHRIFLIFYLPANAILWASLHYGLATILIHVATIGNAVKYYSKIKLDSGNSVKIYRELILFSRLFENAFGRIGFLANLIQVTSLLIVSAYGLVRFFGKVIPKLYIAFLIPVLGINIYLARLLLPSGLIEEHAVELKRNILSSIKNEVNWERKLVKATVRSLPDLKEFISNCKLEFKDMDVPLKSIPCVTVLTFITLGRTWAATSAAISHPASPIFLYAMLPSSWMNGLTHKIFLAFYIPANAIMWASLHYGIATIMIHVATIGNAVEYYSEVKLDPKNNVKVYRKLILFCRLFENAFGRIGFLANLITVTSLLIVSAYGLVRFFGKVIPKLYIAFLMPVFGINIYMIKLLLPSGLISENSAEIKRNIMTSNKNDTSWNKRLMKAAVRSLPDLKVRVGIYFSIQRKTYITLLGIISVNTMTLLINL
ncbi:unnamed protein product, partial [Allacma fusca]